MGTRATAWGCSEGCPQRLPAAATQGLRGGKRAVNFLPRALTFLRASRAAGCGRGCLSPSRDLSLLNSSVHVFTQSAPRNRKNTTDSCYHIYSFARSPESQHTSNSITPTLLSSFTPPLIHYLSIHSTNHHVISTSLPSTLLGRKW